MSKLFEILGVKNEDEAIEKLKIITTPPVSITIVATTTGSLEISTTGNPGSDLVQSLLLDAAKAILMEKTKKAPN